jgi:short-subunit dehydrogenase
MSSETVLITGASSGIGLELARLFAADKSNLILVARRQEKLDQLATEFAAAANLEHKLLFRLGTLSATAVAQAGYRGFRRGRSIVIPGLKNKLLAAVVRCSPRTVVRKVVKRLQS